MNSAELPEELWYQALWAVERLLSMRAQWLKAGYEARLQAKEAATIAGRDLLTALYERQEGRCVHWGDWFTERDTWQVHHRQWRVYGGDDSLDNLELLHGNCNQQMHNRRMETKQAAFREGRLKLITKKRSA